MLEFQLLEKRNKTRRGILKTAHGEIRTPCFMPVGTQAAMKACMTDTLAASGAQVVLCNTYHLMLRPGSELIRDCGGLHKFMNWHRPILTDSGGFQVMSLNKLRKITENGVVFKSHIDGSKHELTPEKSIKIQHDLNSDITMVFDECTPYPATHEEAEKSMLLSMRWAKRSKDSFIDRKGCGLFGIVQGSIFDDLRKDSAEQLAEIGFDGYAIGGLAVGEGQGKMFTTLDTTIPNLPEDKPRYLMGVGKPDDIIGAIKRGVDMFDCVIPGRSGRFGRAYTSTGEVNIKNSIHKNDKSSLDKDCDCPVCRNYSRAYLRHLFIADEMLGPMLLTQHNLHFYQNLINNFISEYFAD